MHKDLAGEPRAMAPRSVQDRQFGGILVKKTFKAN